MTLSVVAIGESSVTTLPEDLADVIRERYGFAELVPGDRLNGGYANDIFRIEADGTPYVVRVQRRPVDTAGLLWEHRLLTALASRVEEVVAPIAARDGSPDGLLVPLVGVRRVLELIRAPYDREVDWDYQLANLDAFERLG